MFAMLKCVWSKSGGGVLSPSSGHHQQRPVTHLRQFYDSRAFPAVAVLSSMAAVGEGAAGGSPQNKPEGGGEDVSAGLGEGEAERKPVCLIVLGMAGSGKTTFVQVPRDCAAALHLPS